MIPTIILPLLTSEATTEAEKFGISGIISKASMKNRFKDHESALYKDDPMLSSEEDYTKWFINKKEKLQYMYIPSQQKLSNKFLNFLKKTNAFFYLEDTSNFSLFQLIVAIAFFIVAFIYAQRKTIFFSAALPFVLFAAFQKGILAISASLLMMYTIAFWVEAVGLYLKFTKDQLLTRIKKNPLLVFFPVISLIVANFNSRISLLLFILAIIASLSFAYISEKVKFFITKKLEERMLHKKIEAYAMNPKSVEKFWDTKKLIVVSTVAVVAIIFSSLFLFFRNTKTLQVSKNTISLPHPGLYLSDSDLKSNSLGFTKENYEKINSLKEDDDLPNLANFITDKWTLITMPYRNLHREEKNGIIRFTDYSSDEENKVQKTKTIEFKLDDEFINTTLALRDKASIENMLYKQREFITASYTYKRFPLNSFNFAAFIVALLTAFMPIIIIFMRVRDK